MKVAKITLKTVILFFVFTFIALVLARIMISDHYPKEMTAFTFTEKTANFYSTTVDKEPEKFEVLTQNLMAPYDDPKDGNFFATAMLCVPNAGSMQACLRYNIRSTFPKMSAFYGEEVAGENPLELLDFSLLVSYENGGEAKYVRYPMNVEESFTDDFMMYRYVKLLFDDVDFQDAIWMRVDIYLASKADGYDEENRFGSIVLYEKYEIRNGQKIDYPFSVYTLSEEEKKRVS